MKTTDSCSSLKIAEGKNFIAPLYDCTMMKEKEWRYPDLFYCVTVNAFDTIIQKWKKGPRKKVECMKIEILFTLNTIWSNCGLFITIHYSKNRNW